MIPPFSHIRGVVWLTGFIYNIRGRQHPLLSPLDCPTSKGGRGCQQRRICAVYLDCPLARLAFLFECNCLFFFCYWNPNFTVCVVGLFVVHFCKRERKRLCQFIICRHKPFGVDSCHCILQSKREDSFIWKNCPTYEL